MNTTLTKIDQEKRKIEQICIWNSMTTGFFYINIALRLECLQLSRTRSRETIPGGEERGETAVFAG